MSALFGRLLPAVAVLTFAAAAQAQPAPPPAFLQMEVCAPLVDGLCTLDELVRRGLAGRKIPWKAVPTDAGPAVAWEMTVAGSVRWRQPIRWQPNCVQRLIEDSSRNYAVLSIDGSEKAIAITKVARRVAHKLPPEPTPGAAPPADFLRLEACAPLDESQRSCRLEELVRVGVGAQFRGWKHLGRDRWGLALVRRRNDEDLNLMLIFARGCSFAHEVATMESMTRNGRKTDGFDTGILVGPLFDTAAAASGRRWQK